MHETDGSHVLVIILRHWKPVEVKRFLCCRMHVDGRSRPEYTRFLNFVAR